MGCSGALFTLSSAFSLFIVGAAATMFASPENAGIAMGLASVGAVLLIVVSLRQFVAPASRMSVEVARSLFLAATAFPLPAAIGAGVWQHFGWVVSPMNLAPPAVAFAGTSFTLCFVTLFHLRTNGRPGPRRKRRSQKPEAWKAAVLALFLPGAGHFYRRQFMRGLLFMLAFACLLPIPFWLLSQLGPVVAALPQGPIVALPPEALALLVKALVGGLPALAVYHWQVFDSVRGLEAAASVEGRRRPVRTSPGAALLEA